MPVNNAGSGSGGDSVLPQLGGAAGNAGSGTAAGSTTAGAALGGTGAAVGAGGTEAVDMGGAPDLAGGAAGAAGAAGSPAVPDCARPQSVVGAVTADTWIESIKPNANHGSAKSLSVIAGGEERRALLQVAVPPLPTNAVLLRATLALHLESNADPNHASRRLALSELEQAVQEGRASWLNWGNGNRAWTRAGGDFGPVLATAVVPEGVSDAALSFDVTVAVEQALSTQSEALPLIVLETGAPPPAPAELALTSKEGNASGIPALIVDYCEP